MFIILATEIRAEAAEVESEITGVIQMGQHPHCMIHMRLGGLGGVS